MKKEYAMMEHEMENRTILIVDDDESTVVSLNFIFKKQGLKVFTAKSGKEALLIL